ncbi:MAG: type II toxin-antitoxin system RelE/ParE family toxin [Magnetococcales bacterium]|nr:type II toxin-antitoxin system RelE/ParE family toxin [Magnetococcales bacterium]
MKLRFTASARAEFLAALDYIRQENPSAAQAYFQYARQALRRLEAFPYSGRSLPEFPDLPHREVIVPPYRFIYRVTDDTAWIVAIWHGARLPVRLES